MAEWLTIDKETGRVRGWTRGKGAPPDDTEKTTYLLLTQERAAAYQAFEAKHRDEGRMTAVVLTKDGLAEVADTRPHLRIETDVTEIAADGQAVATLTITRLDGSQDTVKCWLFGQLWRLAFDGRGACTKQFCTTQSGHHVAQSSEDARLEAPVAITAYL